MGLGRTPTKEELPLYGSLPKGETKRQASCKLSLKRAFGARTTVERKRP